MKTVLSTARAALEDRLAINDATRHQYYSTMQADVYGDDLLDAALNRRQARALLARRDQNRTLVGLAALTLVAAAGLIWVLG